MIEQIQNSKKSEKYFKLLSSGINHLWDNSREVGVDIFVVNTLEILMLLERDEYLRNIKLTQREKEEQTAENTSPDKANGSYIRSFKSLSKNNLTINIPRSRTGSFKPLVIEILKQNQEQINELTLLLYQKGMTSRDISEILKKFFSEDMSHTTISNLANKFNEIRLSWENTKLDKIYKVIYMDALYQTLRREDSYSKEAVHIIYGITQENKRELLSLSVNPTESANSWELVLKDLKEKKGVENINLIVADGLIGLEDKIHNIYPKAIFQKCVIHKERQVLLKIRPKEKAAVATDLKDVFDNFDELDTIKTAKNKLQFFINKWKSKYPNIKNHFNEGVVDYYFSYIKFDKKVRRSIYTTNSIENLNKQIRKATKNKLSFEKENRLLDYMFVVIKDFEEKNWQKYPVHLFKNWTKIEEEKLIKDTV
jgi:putative transposase